MNTTFTKTLPAVLLLAGLLPLTSVHAHCGSCGAGGKDDSHEHGKSKTEYPLDTCVVSGAKLGTMGDPYVHTTEDGQEVRFCCKGCLPKFQKNPEKYLEKIQEARKDAEPGKDAGSDSQAEDVPHGH